jgi:hypothetical protein
MSDADQVVPAGPADYAARGLGCLGDFTRT